MKKIYFAFLLNCMAILNTVAQPGALDLSFDPGTGVKTNIYGVTLQSNGKIIIGGDFTSYNGTARRGVARLNSDGSLDTSFNPGTGIYEAAVANPFVYNSVIQSDGKIIIGGEFTSYNGTTCRRIARLNINGSLDTSFNQGTGADSWILAIAIQSDGKIIIGGLFTSYNGTARNYIARLNSDGSLDTKFKPGAGANQQVRTIRIQSDGKIIITGIFTSYNGTARNYIARLNSDGSLDTGFNPGTGANRDIWASALQSDGKIIIGGGFTSFNNVTRNHIARVNSDGSLDTTFNPGTGTNDWILGATLQSDGKIIIGGGFTIYNGAVRNRIARVNSDGTLDAGFNPWAVGVDNVPCTSAIQSDGKIIIGGIFTLYNSTARGSIARLQGTDNYNTITGVCYVDSNQNNIQDNGELGFLNEMVSSSDSTSSFGSVTNNQGVFYNISDSGFITTIPKPRTYYTITPSQHVSNFSSYKNTDTINFAFVPLANVQDLRVTLISLNAARTGRDVNYRIVYENVGTKSMSGSVYLTMNSGLTFISANPAYSSLNADTLEWTYSNLAPNESRNIDVTLKVPMSAVIGNALNPSARIEPTLTDTTPNNNYLTLEQVVTGAYDPNDKTVLQGDDITDQQVADGDYLDYLIRFQNTGNDTAFVVVVRDTLDNKLDRSSFEMISSSHNYSVAIRDGKNLAWTFDNILLPDSNVDEPGSHGYICYRIKPKNTILPGDVIKNTAHIFFDYNVPVATNTAVTTVSSPVNISSNPAANKLLIYPNPAGEKITVLCHNPNREQLEILNILGAVVLQTSLQNSITEIDISSLNKGIYFVKTDTGVQPVKLVIQ